MINKIKENFTHILIVKTLFLGSLLYAFIVDVMPRDYDTVAIWFIIMMALMFCYGAISLEQLIRKITK